MMDAFGAGTEMMTVIAGYGIQYVKKIILSIWTFAISNIYFRNLNCDCGFLFNVCIAFENEYEISRKIKAKQTQRLNIKKISDAVYEVNGEFGKRRVWQRQRQKRENWAETNFQL